MAGSKGMPIGRMDRGGTWIVQSTGEVPSSRRSLEDAGNTEIGDGDVGGCVDGSEVGGKGFANVNDAKAIGEDEGGGEVGVG